MVTPAEQTDNEYENASSIIGVLGAIGLGEIFVWGIMAALFLAAVLFFVVLHAMVQGSGLLFWLRLVRGQEASVAKSVHVLHSLIPLSLTTLLMWLAIYLGSLAFTVPALILLLGFQFVELVVLDKNLHYISALSASWEIAQGYKWQLLGLIILIGLLNFAGFLVCGVGIFVTTAIGTGVTVVIYDRIAERGNAYLGDNEDFLTEFD